MISIFTTRSCSVDQSPNTNPFPAVEYPNTATMVSSCEITGRSNGHHDSHDGRYLTHEVDTGDRVDHAANTSDSTITINTMEDVALDSSQSRSQIFHKDQGSSSQAHQQPAQEYHDQFSGCSTSLYSSTSRVASTTPITCKASPSPAAATGAGTGADKTALDNGYHFDDCITSNAPDCSRRDLREKAQKTRAREREIQAEHQWGCQSKWAIDDIKPYRWEEQTEVDDDHYCDHYHFEDDDFDIHDDFDIEDYEGWSSSSSEAENSTG